MNDNKFTIFIIVGSTLIGSLVMVVLMVFGHAADSKSGRIYSICKPNGYEVVCFGTTGWLGNEGPQDCVPLAQAGGKCR